MNDCYSPLTTACGSFSETKADTLLCLLSYLQPSPAPSTLNQCWRLSPSPRYKGRYHMDRNELMKVAPALRRQQDSHTRIHTCTTTPDQSTGATAAFAVCRALHPPSQALPCGVKSRDH
eukprot:1145046-Pelagomonas_calceolata.AAC.7